VEAAVCYGCLTGLHGVQVWAWGVLFASLRAKGACTRVAPVRSTFACS
jgi:hypothetical protein